MRSAAGDRVDPGVEAAGRRASARSSTRGSASTPTRPTPTTSGRCSSSTRGGPLRPRPHASARRSGRWSRSCRRTSSTTAGRRRAHGFRKRVLYLETSVLGEQLIGPRGRPPGHARPLAPRATSHASTTPSAVPTTPSRRRRASRSSPSASGPRWARPLPRSGRPPGGADLAERLRAYLDAHLFESLTMAAAAAALGAGPTQLARAFSDAFGDPAPRLRRRAPAGGGARPDPRRTAVSGRRRRGRVLRPGPPHAAVPRFLGTTPGQFAATAGLRQPED